MDKFTAAYIACALWSSTCDDDTPMDDRYTASDISPEAMAKIQADCAKFQAAHHADITGDIELAGHDFWLTRNGHGAGFWDGDWPEDIGERLTQSCKSYSTCDLYVGDDGKLYVM